MNFPNDDALIVREFILQKRGDGVNPTITIDNIWIEFKGYDDAWVSYLNGNWLPTG